MNARNKTSVGLIYRGLSRSKKLMQRTKTKTISMSQETVRSLEVHEASPMSAYILLRYILLYNKMQRTTMRSIINSHS